MTVRGDLLLEVVSAVDTVITAAVTIEPWAGEQETFNEDATYPRILCEYAGCEFSENLEMGASTRERTFRVRVHVMTKTAAEAFQYLESIENGITNTKLTVDDEPLYMDLESEAVANLFMDRYCYTQHYVGTQMRSA